MPKHEVHDYDPLRQIVLERMSEMGLTKHGVCMEARISPPSLGLFLSGKNKRMSNENFKKLGDLLGFDYKQLLP